MIDFNSVVSPENIKDQSFIALESEEEVEEALAMLDDARHWLSNQPYIGKIFFSFVGFAIPDTFGIFLFEVESFDKEIGNWVWVIIGDTPPAIFSSIHAATTKDALKCYVDEMQRWIDAVRTGDRLTDLIPVDLPPSIRQANALQKRLDFIRSEILEFRPRLSLAS